MQIYTFADENDDDFIYYIIDDAIAIVGYLGQGGDIVIPDTIEGYPVKTILEAAFNSNYDLLSVSIPYGVISIGNDAFANCGRLYSVSIPESIVNIGEGAFDSCLELSNIAIPSGLTVLRKGLFKLCSSLETITIPKNITIIEESVFSYCTALTSVTIPASITIIGDSVFEGCTNLGSATFLGNAPAFGNKVFTQCSTSFKIYYSSTVQGFTTPTWNGYPTEIINTSLTSSILDINSGNSIVSNIAPGSSVLSLKNKINETVKVYKGITEQIESSAVSTGMTVKYMLGQNVIREYSTVIYGDIDGDADIDIVDFSAVKSHLLKQYSLIGIYKEAARVNKQTSISIRDLMDLKKHILTIKTISQG